MLSLNGFFIVESSLVESGTLIPFMDEGHAWLGAVELLQGAAKEWEEVDVAYALKLEALAEEIEYTPTKNLSRVTWDAPQNQESPHKEFIGVRFIQFQDYMDLTTNYLDKNFYEL